MTGRSTAKHREALTAQINFRVKPSVKEAFLIKFPRSEDRARWLRRKIRRATIGPKGE